MRMQLRLYVILFSILTFIALVIWGVYLLSVDPAGADFGMLTLFYLDLFVAFTGLATLLGYGSRIFIFRRPRQAATFRWSLRQGALLAVFLCGLLLLQSERLLTLWNALLWLGALTCAELYAQSKVQQLGASPEQVTAPDAVTEQKPETLPPPVSEDNSLNDL
jgi:membrane protease YdiL (CAAX protease family)